MEIANGRKMPISTPSAASGTNSPLDVTESRKSGPPRAFRDETFTEIARTIGTSARTSRPIWLRRRPPMSRTSERSSRDDTSRLLGACAATSAADIEALPGQTDEEVLEARRGHDEPAHRDA